MLTVIVVAVIESVVLLVRGGGKGRKKINGTNKETDKMRREFVKEMKWDCDYTKVTPNTLRVIFDLACLTPIFRMFCRDLTGCGIENTII